MDLVLEKQLQAKFCTHKAFNKVLKLKSFGTKKIVKRKQKGLILWKKRKTKTFWAFLSKSKKKLKQ